MIYYLFKKSRHLHLSFVMQKCYSGFPPFSRINSSHILSYFAVWAAAEVITLFSPI